MDRRFREWLDGVEGSYDDFCDFLEVPHQFGLKIGCFKKTYNMY